MDISMCQQVALFTLFAISVESPYGCLGSKE